MKKYILSVLIALFAITTTKAQTLKSGYFLDGYFYRHQMNPAYGNERKYFSFPLFGNTNISAESNVGLSTFIYPSNNPKYDLTTFLDPQISSNEFLNGLKNKNKFGINMNMQILSIGFKARNGYATIDLGLKSQLNALLPKDLFAFIKNGMNPEGVTNYELNNFGINTSSYLELAVGFSRNIINDKIRVGGKAKILIGAAYANIFYKDMSVSLSQDKWKIETDGYADMAIPSVGFKTEMRNGKQQVSGFETGGGFAPAGMGLAFDLGATYEVIEDLEVSLAIQDLGFMKWSNVSKAKSDSQYEFNGFNNIAVDKDDTENYDQNSINAQFDNLANDLKDAFFIYSDGEKTSIKKALSATLNIGASYKMPFYKGLSFGFLSSTRIAGKYSTSEGRFYANVTPIQWFDASINYAISSYGSSFGWIINFHPKGFNFFVGSDSQIFKVSPQFIPIKRINANICMGINFPIGEMLK